MESHGTSGPAWLGSLLAPVSVDEFLTRYWLQEHLFCRGPSGRFSGLLSWPALNQLLNHHWRETYRFRLAVQGRDLDPSAYADLDGYTPRIRSRDVTGHLRRGATLSFDAIDELHEPLTRLAESFEAFFRGGTKINIYAGWRALHGLDLHRDNQEIFILQLDGRKRWLLYGFAMDGIDRTGLRTTSVPPRDAVFDQILTNGDLLYIPRGCYHLAIPMNEPTLHLTLGVKNPREMDLLLWLVERMRAAGAEDRDLPCLADRSHRMGFSEDLRRRLLAGVDDDLVGQYLSETRSNLKPRPSFSLPWSATREPLPPGRSFLVRLTVDPRVAMNGGAESTSIQLRWRGHTYRFPRAMRSILEVLDYEAPVAMGLVIDTLAHQLDEDTIRVLIAMLADQDLASISV